MGTSNRVRLTYVRETTPGVTPDTPRMRTMRITKEALTATPQYVDSDELRSDRQQTDSILVMQEVGGSFDGELSFPPDGSPESDILRSAFFNPWANTNFRDNDGTADSVITGVATTNTILTVTTGDAFVQNELYRFTGFGVANNNGNFKCSQGSATVPRFAGSGITDEAAPPAAARVKCIGLEGDASDITATADGFASTTLDFTTIPGLVPGKWLKVDSTTAGNGFATAALNSWVRLTAVAAHALTCDHLPTGWTTDDGDGKSIRIYFGDQIKNGVTPTDGTIEKAFLDQAVPTYIVGRGYEVNTLTFNFASRDKVKFTAALMGLGGTQGTVTLDASPDPASTTKVMAANANVGAVAEGGARLTAPNWSRSLTITINNNLRAIEAQDSTHPVGLAPGDCAVSGNISTYFGDNTLLTKVYNGTATSCATRVAKNNQAMIFQLPRLTARTGDPQAQGKNQDVTLDSDWTASVDIALTGAQVLLDRVEYFA